MGSDKENGDKENCNKRRYEDDKEDGEKENLMKNTTL